MNFSIGRTNVEYEINLINNYPVKSNLRTYTNIIWIFDAIHEENNNKLKSKIINVYRDKSKILNIVTKESFFS